MKEVDINEALHIIENMIRRRLKAQGKYEQTTEAWIKSKALDVYDDSTANGDYIKKLEPDTELQ